METKEMKIVPPDGYEIDKENSTFECIKFKPKSMTYEEVAKKLFDNTGFYFTGDWGRINVAQGLQRHNPYSTGNHAKSERQLKKLRALNKLLNVSRFLNGNWRPDWDDILETKWMIRIKGGKIGTAFGQLINFAPAYFKTQALAQQAIEILGEDTIRLALSTDW